MYILRSMPNENAVVWITDKKHIKKVIVEIFEGKHTDVIQNAQNWFEKINKAPAENATRRIADIIAELTRNI